MNPTDKKRLKDAFNTAIARAPEPDAVIEGMADQAGKPMTFRKLMTATSESEQFYDMIDKAVAAGHTTIDQVVQQISTTTKVRMKP